MSTQSGGSRRHGFTLVELLIGMVLATIVFGAVVTALVRQQRFYRGTAAIVETRSQMRQAAAMIALDLRGISTEGGDIIAMSDDSVVFRATIGSSVVCGQPQANGNIFLPPQTLASGNVLTSWVVEPVQGDELFIYHDDGTRLGSNWQLYTIISDVEVDQNGCPPSTGLTTAADADAARYSLRVSPTPPASVQGAPIRFTRDMRYKLYQAADDQWYLGYCSPGCGAGGWDRVAGPFLPYSANGAGVAFAYLDEDGEPTATRADVARAGIALRGRTGVPLNIDGMRRGHVADSLRVTVAFRNRRR